MSLPPRSPETLYHAVPHHVGEQANVSQIELEGDTMAEPLPLPGDPPLSLVDYRIRWIYFVLGCAVLLPWNVVITAMPFFVARLSGSPLRAAFGSYLTTSFTVSNFLFLAHATATSKQTKPSRQTHRSIIALTFLTFLLTLSTFFNSSPSLFFTFVIFNGAAQACVGAYLQTSVIAVASLFGPPAVQAMITGQAAVAVAVSGVQLISAATSIHGKPRSYVSDGSAEERSAFIFFSLSTLFLVASAVAHHWLVRTPIYGHVAAVLECNSVNRRQEIGHEEERTGLITAEVSQVPINDSKVNTIRVAKQNMIYELAVAYVFIVTLAVYPPITTSIGPTNPETHPLLFSAFHFVVFNVGDFLGRYVCSYPSFLIWSDRRLLTLSVARTLFIPLFLMCNVQKGNMMAISTPVISSDFLFMVILWAFGCSNGYISSLCMMSAGSLDHNPRLKGRAEDVDIAATVASFCLVGGLAIGSLTSFAVKASLCGCNPFTQ